MAEAKSNAARAAWRSAGAIPILMLFVLGLALALVFNRVATDNGVPFIPYVFWQAFGGCVILLILAVTLSSFPPLSWAHWRIYFVAGLFLVNRRRG